MKRILVLSSILLTGVVFAQDNFEDCNNTSKIIKNDFRSDKSAVVIWEEDFGGGFPNGWSSYTNNTGAAGQSRQQRLTPSTRVALNNQRGCPSPAAAGAGRPRRRRCPTDVS